VEQSQPLSLLVKLSYIRWFKAIYFMNIEELLKSWDNLKGQLSSIDDLPINLLIPFALNDSKPEYWRAAWLIEKACCKNPDLLKPFLPDIYAKAKTTNSYSHLRHFLIIINRYPIPEVEQMPIYDFSINLFFKSEAPVAVRAYAMELAYTIVKIHCELRPEMTQFLEFMLEQPCSSGITAKSKNLLALLCKKSSFR